MELTAQDYGSLLTGEVCPGLAEIHRQRWTVLTKLDKNEASLLSLIVSTAIRLLHVILDRLSWLSLPERWSSLYTRITRGKTCFHLMLTKPVQWSSWFTMLLARYNKRILEFCSSKLWKRELSTLRSYKLFILLGLSVALVISRAGTESTSSFYISIVKKSNSFVNRIRPLSR